MNKQLLLFFTILLIATLKPEVHGQSQDSKFNNIPYFTFEKGLGINSPDSSFLLNFRFSIQNRIAYMSASRNIGETGSIQAGVRRLRIRYDGYVFMPRLSYVIQLGFSTGDIDFKSINMPNILRDAVIFYRCNEHFTFAFGQTKLPGNRERMNSSSALELADRSIVNSAFNIDRDFGFQGFYTNNLNRFYFFFRGAISTGEGRSTPETDQGLAYTGRIELLPFGTFRGKGNNFEGDILREATPKLALGFTAHTNRGAIRENGQSGSFLYESRDLKGYFVDLILKYNGWALMADYLSRDTDNPVTSNARLEHRIVYTGYGMNYQTSYVFRSNWQIIGRVSSLFPKDEIYQFEDQIDQYTLGITRYIRDHRLKVQSDISFEDRGNPVINQHYPDNWQIRFQVEMGI